MPGYADVIFAGGAIYTANPSGRRMIRATAPDGGQATAVAVADGTIVAVGAATDVAFADLEGPRTERVDLNGRALLPGFQDAHVHPAFAGVTMIGCNLIGAATLEEALARISSYAARQEHKEWIAGSGWRMEWFSRGTPGRQLLDQVTGGRPAYLTNRDSHGSWVSSRALELAGVGGRTPDPPDGRIYPSTDASTHRPLPEAARNLSRRHRSAAH